MMNSSRSLILTVVLGLSLFGCSYQQSFPVAFVANRGMVGVSGNYTAYSYSEGEACAKSILGVVAFGNASIERAANIARITHVTSVNHKVSGLFSIFHKHCVIVQGY